MNKFIYWLNLLLLIVLVHLPSVLKASAVYANQECIIDTTLTQPGEHINVVNLSFKLPCYGTFSAGTGKCASGEPYWVASTSGLALVSSYSTQIDAYGEVGLKCWPGSTATIELSTTLTISTSGNSSYDWNQLVICVHYRMNTTTNNTDGSRYIAGLFQVQAWDAYSTQVIQGSSFDAGSITTTANTVYVTLGTSSSWVTFATQYGSPHQDWFKISKLRLSYAVPYTSSQNVPATEVLIDQIVLGTYNWGTEYGGWPGP